MGRTRKLQWVLYPSFLVIIAVCLVSVGTYTIVTVRNLFVSQTESRLESRARLAVDVLAQQDPSDTSALRNMVGSVGRAGGARITVISVDGRVVADSVEDAAHLGNHLDRPEVADAIRTGTGRAVRFSPTQKRDLMYFAMTSSSLPGLVVRASMPAHDAQKALADMIAKMLLGALVAALGAAFVSWLVSRRVARPVEKMAAGVHALVREAVPGRIEEPDVLEFQTLAAAMNTLSEALSSRLSTTTTQQKELESTLSSMNEAVLLLDHDDRIRLINSAGAALLKIDPRLAVGLSIPEVVGTGSLREFVARAAAVQEPYEEDITIEGDKTKFVHAFKTVIRDDAGGFSAILLVLHDITRLKRLENIRRDFVANVSHELKTPITSIKGFVETLRSGETHDPETVTRFLDIIARHTDRLNSIIEDLLVLSRIEQAENAGGGARDEDPGIARENVLVSSIVESVVLVCESRAAKKNIRLDVDCQPDSVAFVNQQLMEQALVNLVDNSIKFSDPNQDVRVQALVVDGRLRLTVTDHGCGIPPEHQSRIFERFYRVDKGRSRAQGGTGLGLAIVRHVATIHGGKVRVQSVPGEGSRFVIDVPALQAPGSES